MDKNPISLYVVQASKPCQPVSNFVYNLLIYSISLTYKWKLTILIRLTGVLTNILVMSENLAHFPWENVKIEVLMNCTFEGLYGSIPPPLPPRSDLAYKSSKSWLHPWIYSVSTFSGPTVYVTHVCINYYFRWSSNKGYRAYKWMVDCRIWWRRECSHWLHYRFAVTKLVIMFLGGIFDLYE